MAKYSNIESLFRKVNKDLEDVRTEFYKGLVDTLVAASPVDTGAYMDSHGVGTNTKSVGYVSKEGDHTARNVAYGPVADRARAKMYAEIDALPPDADKVYIANRSPHSGAVENGGHRWQRGGYYPFRIMRREAGRIFEAAKATIKGRSG